MFIGSETFCQCGSLESITIPESVISIGEGVFQGCERLECIRIPKAVEEILDEKLDVPYVICYSEYIATFAEYPIYLGGSLYDLSSYIKPGALEGFLYAKEHGITEIDQWEDDYRNYIAMKNAGTKAPKERRVSSIFNELLAHAMRDSFLDIEGLSLETGLTEEEINDYLCGRKPSLIDVYDIAESLDYDPDIFFETDND